MNKILLIDNYDSFSYNLYQYIGELAAQLWGPAGAAGLSGVAGAADGSGSLAGGSGEYEIKVIRNDAMTVEGVKKYAPSHIIISPGPGRPADAGICEELIKELAGSVPILGVCLGHQAICEAFGATITYAGTLMHGKQSVASLDLSCPIFNGLVSEIEVARYHSLVADASTMPDCLKVVARTADGEIMAVAHTSARVYGLQFHPESILTPAGKTILSNFFRFG